MRTAGFLIAQLFLLCSIAKSQVDVGVIGVGPTSQCNEELNQLQTDLAVVGECIEGVFSSSISTAPQPPFLGNYLHVAVCKTFSTGTVSPQYSSTYQSNDLPNFQVQVSCSGGQLLRYSVPLNPVYSISGYVTEGSLIILPVIGATVSIPALQVSTTTDLTGYYSLTFSAAGTNIVEVAVLGITVATASFVVSGNNIANANIHI